MMQIKKYAFISIPVIISALVLVSFILTSKERSKDIIYGATVYNLPVKTAEETAFESAGLECKRFCDTAKSLNDTQKEFMLSPLSTGYCSLGFNETFYKKDVNSDGVLNFIPCTEMYNCSIKFENIGITKLNCTK